MATEITDSHGKQIEPVLLTHFGDGATALTNRDISADLQVLTDLKKAGDNADGVSVETANILKMLARLTGWNGSAWSRVRIEDSSNDTLATSRDALVAHAQQRLYNSATGVWERRRNNAEATVLASAARSADADGADQVNYNHKGIVLFVDCSAVAGDDTFKIQVQGKSPGGGYYEIFTTAELSGTGLRVYEIHPSVAAASGGVTGVAARLIPRTWRVSFDYTQVTGDADTITAGVYACYLP